MAVAQPVRPRPPHPGTSVPIRVLLVEDMQQLRGVVTELLQSLGEFQVVAEVSTEAEAKSWLEDHTGGWELAVVDLILEQGTGMGVISRCRKTSKSGRIVVLSDYATPGIRKHCLNLGANAVFQKSSEASAFADYCAALAVNATAPPKSPEAGPPAT